MILTTLIFPEAILLFWKIPIRMQYFIVLSFNKLEYVLHTLIPRKLVGTNGSFVAHFGIEYMMAFLHIEGTRAFSQQT